MHTFEITIQRQSDGGFPVIAEEHQDGGRLPVRVEGQLTIDQNELLAAEVDRAAYGRLLGRALFAGVVHDAFIEALARDEGLLRVLLFIEDVSLRALRWERLYAPVEGDWKLLSTYQRAPYSRYLPSLTDRRFPPIGRRDLRALIVAASPAAGNRFQLEPFDAAAATDGVRAALDPIPTTLLADLPGADGRPTLDEICAQITTQPITILHLVAHGRVLKDGESVVYLAGGDGPGAVDPVTGTRLLERLSSLEGARGLPRFAFLSTCESASPDADEALGGLGQRLVRELGMPAVVAMTDKVSIPTANALSAAIYTRLREHGEPDRALVEGAVRLAERGDVMVPVLFSRLGGRPLFSDTLDRPLTAAELTAGLDTLGRLLPERAPVLGADFTRAASALRRTLEGREELADAAARAARADALLELEAICSEATGVSFQSLCLGDAPPAYDSRCPFPGLRSFQADLRDFFFGRERLVQRLMGRVGESPFLAVLGPSGSGKSSLVFAGLAPALLAARPELKLLTITPGDLPLASLLVALEQAGPAPASDGGPPVARGLLVVDQFEEAFTLCRDADERQAFFEELLRQVGHFLIVITMRADFLGEVAPYAALRDMVTAHQELVAPMTPEELRRAMELQAAAVGLRFEADLGGQILDDVRDEPGAMPLLQHALQELWQRRRGIWLRAAEYRAIGGIQQAIAHSADQIYSACSPEDKERLRAIFVRLTRLDAEESAEQQRDTRQRVDMAELVPAGADPAPTRALVGRLADARLVVTGVSPAGAETAEVAHEALIRSWPRLRGWLSEDRQGLLLREAISRAAREWADGKQDEGFLFRGARLDEAAALAHLPRFALNAAEMSFVDAGLALREREAAEREAARQRELQAAKDLAEEQQRRADEAAAAAVRQRRLSRIMTGATAAAVAFLLLAVAIMGYAFGQAQAARSAEADANAQEALAKTAEAAAKTNEGLAKTAEAAAKASEAEAQTQKAAADTASEQASSSALQAAAQAAMSAGDLSLSIAIDSQRVTRNSDDVAALYDLSQVAYPPGVRRQIDLAAEQAGSFVTAFALSPNGEQVATGGDSGTLAIWNLDDGGLASSTAVADDPINSIAFNPDGSSLAVARDQSGVTIQTLSGERSLGTTKDGSRPLVVAYSPDGTRLAVVTENNQVAIWDTSSFTVAATITARGPVSSVAFSPAGPELLTGNLDGSATLWDLNTQKPLVRFDGGLNGASRGENGERVRHSDEITSVAFNPNGSLAITGSVDQTIGVWDVGRRNPAAIGFLTGHTAAVRSVQFSPDGQQIISASDDGTVRIWGGQNLSELLRLEAHGDGAIGAYYRPQSSPPQAVSLGYGAESAVADEADLRLWDLTDGREIGRVYAPGPADDVALSDDGSLGLVASSDGVESIDMSTTETIQQISVDNPALPAVAALSGDGATAAIGGNDGTITLWNPRSGETLGTLEGHSDKIESLAFSADGARLASGSFDKTLRIWDVAGRSETQSYDIGQLSGTNRPLLVQAIAWRPDGGTLLLGTNEGLWTLNATTGAAHQGESWPAIATLAVAWNSDGSALAAGTSNNLVWVIDAASEEVEHTFAHRGPVQGVAFSADDSQVISAAADRRIALWDLDTGKEIQHIDVSEGTIASLAIDRSSGDILTGSDNGAARIWRFDSLDTLLDWVSANRYVPELPEDLKAQLGL